MWVAACCKDIAAASSLQATVLGFKELISLPVGACLCSRMWMELGACEEWGLGTRGAGVLSLCSLELRPWFPLS